MTTYRFNRRRVRANASRRRGIPGVLDVRALSALRALAGSKQPADEAAILAGSGQVTPRIGGGYVR
jgi:hypothetical protein